MARVLYSHSPPHEPSQKCGFREGPDALAHVPGEYTPSIFTRPACRPDSVMRRRRRGGRRRRGAMRVAALAGCRGGARRAVLGGSGAAGAVLVRLGLEAAGGVLAGLREDLHVLVGVELTAPLGVVHRVGEEDADEE